MGGCCSINIECRRYVEEEMGHNEHRNENDEEDDHVSIIGDYGAIVRLKGCSKNISMFTQQGRKGINQDALTVWENFTGDKDTVFCGVFDGHGPAGHKISRYARDNLPSKLSSAIKQLRINDRLRGDDNSASPMGRQNQLFRLLEASFIASFEELDQQLSLESAMDSYYSGTTAVNVIKKGEHLIIANLGDSRAVLGARDEFNQLVPVQLTTDLKPDIASEAERIRSCKGRVFALDQEPDVYRIWMPDDNCPGLAMARAFGDFCLKDHGLISAPQVFYRKLTRHDEFVVLATDGVWDVLTNMEVIRTVAQASRRETAAKLVINRAVRAWRTKYPGSKVDDCAVICLFFGRRPLIVETISEFNYSGCSVSVSNADVSVNNTCRSIGSCNEPADTVIGKRMKLENYIGHNGVSSVNSLAKLPRFTRGSSRRRSSSGTQVDED